MLILRAAALSGDPLRHDVCIHAGVVTGVLPEGSARAGHVIECGGSLLLPGLHDHHCHLLAMAAADRSVHCGPPDVRTTLSLASALARAQPHGGWIRGVGYDEAVAGRLDRTVLDGLRADVPIRIQHRGGSLWILNSGAAARVGLDDADEAGIERDCAGRATGRLWRMDKWLRHRIGAEAMELGSVSNRLAALGITGVTDATPDLDEAAVLALTSGAVRQRLVLLGSDVAEGAVIGPRKIVVADHALPSFDDLCRTIGVSRPRAVAVHCVTQAALVLTLAALRDVGTVAGDRVEHAAVAPPELAVILADLGVAVVTQPSLVALRGDDYLKRVGPEDLDHLWPFRSLLDAGVEVGCSSDAPYGDPDPWSAVATAVSRLAPSGRAVAERQAVSAQQALAGFLTNPLRPGGAPRRVNVGAPADLVLLDRPLSEILRAPSADAVRLTIIAGEIVHRAE